MMRWRLLAGLALAIALITPRICRATDWTDLDAVVWADLVIVQVQVNGEGPFPFLLDSGAPHSALDPGLASELGIRPLRDERRGRIALGVGLTAAGLHTNTRFVSITNLQPMLTVLGHDLRGILGNDFLRLYCVRIDYERERVQAVRARDFQHDGTGTVVPLISGEHPIIVTTLPTPGSGEVGAVLILDSGSNESLTLFSRFADAHGLPPGDRPTHEAHVQTLVGEDRSPRFLQPALPIGPFEFREIPTSINRALSRKMGDFYDGLIGAAFLRRFTVTLDYPGRRLVLEPNARLDDPLRGPGLGCGFASDPPEFLTYRCVSVRPGGPAAEAGVREGDELVELGPLTGEELTRDTATDLIRAAGDDPMRIVVRRDGELIELTITPRDEFEEPDGGTP